MSNISRRLAQVNQNLSQKKISEVAIAAFKANTPIRTGYARNHTKLVGKTIQADYNYASNLEDGYSKQAPRGMTEPTIKAVRKYIRDKTGISVSNILS